MSKAKAKTREAIDIKIEVEAARTEVAIAKLAFEKGRRKGRRRNEGY